MYKILKGYGVKPIELFKNHQLLRQIQDEVRKSDAPTSAKVRIMYFKDLHERVPRKEMDKHVKFITSTVKTAIAVGSYRRGAESSRDIDIIVREPIGVALSKLGKYVKNVVSSGKVKATVVVALPKGKHRLLDILKTSSTAHPFAMLYMTGSKRFNIVMRLKAKKKGLKLNELGLFDDHQLVPNLKTERDVFKALDMEYVPPEKR